MGESHSIKVAASDPAMSPAPTPPAQQPAVNEAAPATAPDRPQWLPEKFQSPEDLAKAYGELERKMGTKPTEPATIKSKPAEDTLAEFEQEFATAGNLSEDSYKKLESRGYPKRLVDGYIEGMKAKAQSESQRLYEAAGGQEQFQQMAEWAATSMSPDEVTSLNSMFAQGGSQAQLALRSLRMSFMESRGSEPNLVSGDGPVRGSAYANWDEFLMDVKNSKYSSDPNFRRSVEERLKRSNL